MDLFHFRVAFGGSIPFPGGIWRVYTASGWRLASLYRFWVVFGESIPIPGGVWRVYTVSGWCLATLYRLRVASPTARSEIEHREERQPMGAPYIDG